MKPSFRARLCSLAAVLIFCGGLLWGCGSAAPAASPTPTLAPPTPTPAPSATAATPTPQASTHVVEVVYFHRAQRCSGCIYAGDTTQYTVETYFADELASGEIVFRTLNLQDPANTAMVDKYGAYTSSLFINDVREGVDHIEQVTEIWLLLHNDEPFVSLVKSEIDEHLGA